MALATRCPNCSALFRVAAEQLKSHRGMVRCGACRKVFNAVGRLDYLESHRLTPVTKSASAPPADSELARSSDGRPTQSVERNPDAARDSTAQWLAATGGSPSSAIDAQAPATQSSAENSPQTLMDEQIELRAVETNLDDAPAGERGRHSSSESAPPQFLQAEPRQLPRGLAIARACACALLAPVLLAQVALLFRAPLIVYFPAAQAALSALCAPLSCQAQWPMRPDLLAMVSSELQSLPGTKTLELDAVIRNRASFPMALPSIELTLTDSINRPLARKVFVPADYQTGQRDGGAPRNLAPEADLPVRIFFDLPDNSAAGFVAYPFYP